MVIACVTIKTNGFMLYCKCDECGKLFSRSSYQLYNINKHRCSSKCYGNNKKSVSYKSITDRSNRKRCVIRIHRHIIENYIGRFLLSTEQIHHMDGDIHNNNLFNLIIVSRSEHNKLHRRNINENI